MLEENKIVSLSSNEMNKSVFLKRINKINKKSKKKEKNQKK